MPVYCNPDFRRLPPGLGKIFARRRQDGFFAQPEWYDLMARYAGTGEVRVYAGETAALLLRRTTGAERRLESLANFYSVEHAVLSATRADLSSALDEVMAAILDERPAWEALRLLALDPREPAWTEVAAALRRAGFLIEPVLDFVTRYEETAGLGFAEYLAGRPSELRHTWQRKRRQVVAGQRLAKAFFAGPEDIERGIADYETVYAASWKTPEPFPAFTPALIRLAAEQGALRLGLFYIDGVAAAAQFWIVADRRAVIYKLAHDQRFDRLSLGTLLTMEMIERVLAEDRPDEINFGRGDDPYKQSWLPRRREHWGILAANPRTLRGLRLGLWRETAKRYHRLRGEAVAPRR